MLTRTVFNCSLIKNSGRNCVSYFVPNLFHIWLKRTQTSLLLFCLQFDKTCVLIEVLQTKFDHTKDMNWKRRVFVFLHSFRIKKKKGSIMRKCWYIQLLVFILDSESSVLWKVIWNKLKCRVKWISLYQYIFPYIIKNSLSSENL